MSLLPDLFRLETQGGEKEDDVKYTKERKEKVLLRMMAPGNVSVSVLAREFNITEATLYAWRRSGTGRWTKCSAVEWRGKVRRGSGNGSAGRSRSG